MTEKQLYDLIGFTNLDMANGIESFNDCFYYYFEFGDTGFYILTDEWNDKIGIFYIMSDDIHIQMIPNARGHKYMSTFLKHANWKRYCSHIESITISSYHISSLSDYDMKVHLVNDLLQIPCRNADNVIESVIIDYAPENVWKLRNNYKGNGKLHYYHEILGKVGYKWDI